MGDDKHPVHVDEFYMDINLVTVGEYALFCQATERKMPTAPEWGWIYNHPMVNVSWYDAADYAKWIDKSLPTEEQWEKAARGTDGRKYPWGDTWDQELCWHYGNSPNGGTHPIGQLPKGASPYGCLDMVGNVWEWTDSWCDNDQECRVLHGGSWNHSTPRFMRCANRDIITPGYLGGDYGFRCALRQEVSSTLSNLEQELLKAKKALSEVENSLANYNKRE